MATRSHREDNGLGGGIPARTVNMASGHPFRCAARGSSIAVAVIQSTVHVHGTVRCVGW